MTANLPRIMFYLIVSILVSLDIAECCVCRKPHPQSIYCDNYRFGEYFHVDHIPIWKFYMYYLICAWGVGGGGGWGECHLCACHLCARVRVSPLCACARMSPCARSTSIVMSYLAMSSCTHTRGKRKVKQVIVKKAADISDWLLFTAHHGTTPLKERVVKFILYTYYCK